jgi:hypothetical protein
MDLTDAKAQSGIDRWSIPAALVAGSCNLLSVIFVNYQIYLEQTSARPFVLNYPIVISECFLLTPVLVAIIFRHFAAIMLIYASALFMVLAGRTYYLVKYYFSGVSALRRPFDAPDAMLFLLGAVSVGLVLLWAVIRLAIVAKPPRNRTFSETSS